MQLSNSKPWGWHGYHLLELKFLLFSPKWFKFLKLPGSETLNIYIYWNMVHVSLSPTPVWGHPPPNTPPLSPVLELTRALVETWGLFPFAATARVQVKIFGHISLCVCGNIAGQKVLPVKELLTQGTCVFVMWTIMQGFIVLITVFGKIWWFAGLGNGCMMQSPFGVILSWLSSTAPLGFKGRCNDPHRKENLGVISGRSKTPRFQCLLPRLEVYGQNFSLQVSYWLHFPFLPSSFLPFFLSFFLQTFLSPSISLDTWP